VSQLAALEEVTIAVRRLLAGETVTMQGRHVYLDGVILDFPPAQHVPISLGLRSAKSLAVAGRVAEGTILAEGSSVAYVEWARTQIAATAAHPITMFAWWAPSHDALRPTIAATLANGLDDVRLARPGLRADVSAWREAGGDVNEVPDAWIDELAFVGSIDTAKEKARQFDVSSVIFSPIGGPPFPTQ
jgi:5,10-methylenetetrahydromethanopterin reductase